MATRIGIRALRLISLLLGLSFLTFALVSLSPIDPVTAYLNPAMGATDAQLDALKARWGLGEPWPVRYLAWLTALLSGDFGISQIYQAPVLGIITRAFFNSLLLMMVSWVLSGIIGYILGCLAAHRRGKLLDRMISWLAYTLASTPTFVVGLVLLIIFGVWLGIAPIGLSQPVGMLSEDVTFADRAQHFILPCVALTLMGIAQATLHSRQAMVDFLSSETATFATARGKTPWQIFRDHGLRNTVIPVIVLQCAFFSELFGGSALAEVVFSYHGLGSVMTEAGLRGDLPLLLGAVMFSCLFVFFGNLLADIIVASSDPRTRKEAP